MNIHSVEDWNEKNFPLIAIYKKTRYYIYCYVTPILDNSEMNFLAYIAVVDTLEDLYKIKRY